MSDASHPVCCARSGWRSAGRSRAQHTMCTALRRHNLLAWAVALLASSMATSLHSPRTVQALHCRLQTRTQLHARPLAALDSAPPPANHLPPVCASCVLLRAAGLLVT